MYDEESPHPVATHQLVESLGSTTNAMVQSTDSPWLKSLRAGADQVPSARLLPGRLGPSVALPIDPGKRTL
jgi:hypothetical protein